MEMEAQRKAEPGEFDACFSEASAGPGWWGSSYPAWIVRFTGSKTIRFPLQ